jgi:hypothetical protein
MLMMLPLLALVFIVMDTAYGLFINATLQYAVQAGVTYASTDSDTAANVVASVTNLVASQSLNLAQNITVSFYTPAMAPQQMGVVAIPNQTGNVVEVNATYPFTPLAPLFRSGATINLSATAASVLTAPPIT